MTAIVSKSLGDYLIKERQNIITKFEKMIKSGQSQYQFVLDELKKGNIDDYNT